MKKKILEYFFEAVAGLLAGVLLWWSAVAFVCVVAVGIVGFVGFILFVDVIGGWLCRRK